MNLRRVITLAAVSAGLAACSTTPPPSLISLPLPESSPLAPAPAMAASAPRNLTVRRITIPEYAQTDAVRYRLADNTLVEWPNTTWAERLEVGMTSQLALRLRQALPGWTVCDAHCQPAKGLVLMVNIAPLDYVRPQQALRADVHWRLMGPDSPMVPLSVGGRPFSAKVEQDSPVGQAAAIGALLSEVAQDIVLQVR
ncbi:MAG: hypothetical protein EOP38_13080 [Rubrivivax sp.]|nr:MAG: hypothetical protein EOP38_13080 [Rubrivivax sp.]